MNMYVYETHVEVSDMERSIQYYESLGLILGRKGDRASFFFVDETKSHMIGLWPVTDRPVHPNHFAFHVDVDFVLNAESYLKERGIELTLAHGREPVEPVVHTWVPAVSVYFLDPDGNKLEYIALLDSEPYEHDGVIPYYSEWLGRMGRSQK